MGSHSFCPVRSVHILYCPYGDWTKISLISKPNPWKLCTLLPASQVVMHPRNNVGIQVNFIHAGSNSSILRASRKHKLAARSNSDAHWKNCHFWRNRVTSLPHSSEKKDHHSVLWCIWNMSSMVLAGSQGRQSSIPCITQSGQSL